MKNYYWITVDGIRYRTEYYMYLDAKLKALELLKLDESAVVYVKSYLGMSWRIS